MRKSIRVWLVWRFAAGMGWVGIDGLAFCGWWQAFDGHMGGI